MTGERHHPGGRATGGQGLDHQCRSRLVELQAAKLLGHIDTGQTELAHLSHQLHGELLVWGAQLVPAGRDPLGGELAHHAVDLLLFL
jgi:hypothetical protein